jgi:hypothetical protein
MEDTAAPISVPYPDARPWTRWWWFSGEIREEDVRHQLKWIKDNGFGGAEIAWVYPQPWSRPGPRWLSREWSAAVAGAKRIADELGLGLDYTFGTLWPFGGSFVGEADSCTTFDGPSAARLDRTWEEPYSPGGRILNHLDGKALSRYASRMGPALAEAMQGRRSGLFCDSWEVPVEKLWTAGFGERFRERFGYGIEPFMPDLAADPGARYDYRKLISDLILDEFYTPFAGICRELGGFSRVQAHGAPVDILAAYASSDVPETEAVLFDPAFASFASSAATLTGKPIVSSETFTCLYGWKPWPGPGPHQGREQIADMKLLADSLFANGVNHVVWHGMPYNARGGSNRFYAGVHVGPDSGFRSELPGFNAYMERVCTAMRRGSPSTGLAVYLPIEDNFMRDRLPDDLRKPSGEYWWELHYQRFPRGTAGYPPTWISQRFLRESRYEDGRLRCGSASFGSLVVDVEWLDPEALSEILRLASAGLPVCLPRKPRAPGRMPPDSYEKDFMSLVSLPNVGREIRRVDPGEPLVSGDDIPEFACRTDGRSTVFFFANPLGRSITYPMGYGQSHSWEVVTHDLLLHVHGRRIELNLKFRPYQSLLVTVDRSGGAEVDDLGYHPPDPVVEK